MASREEGVKVAVEVANLIINYGIPTAQKLFSAIDTASEIPTLQQIRDLRGKLKDPEEYFK